MDSVRWSREVAAFFLAKGLQPRPATTAEEKRAELQQLLKLPLAYVRCVEGFNDFVLSAGWMQARALGQGSACKADLPFLSCQGWHLGTAGQRLTDATGS